MVARLGGFIGQKSDGEPGVKTIWLGLKEVHVAAKTMGGLRAEGNVLVVYNAMNLILSESQPGV